jgi:hypothetical protein
MSKTASVGAYFDYYVYDGANIRIGTVMSVWNGVDITYTELSTTDIGDTSPISLSTDILDDDIILLATITSGTWIATLSIRLI